mgnify:CR=1 FL=1|jgi:HlyD family secretion protein
MRKIISFLSVLVLFSCSEEYEKTKPITQNITESIYASGSVHSDNQYMVFPKVAGVIENVYVQSGDLVIDGSPLISIYDETQRLNSENAALTAKFYDFHSNVEQLNEMHSQIQIAEKKMRNDSTQFDRQMRLKEEDAATEVEFEGSQLAYENSKNNYENSIRKYNEYERQLKYNSAQSKKNLQILGNARKDFTVFSELTGKVYSLDVNKGEMVNQQTLIAVLGDAEKFVLEMQVDEDDILKIQLGMDVKVTLDSYSDESFDAKITKIHPIMNEQTKTFLLEAEFVEQPEILYPNMNFEANIVIQEKEEALLIPRNYVINGNQVLNSKGDTIDIETGLKDYKMIEVLSGLTLSDELRKPE